MTWLDVAEPGELFTIDREARLDNLIAEANDVVDQTLEFAGSAWDVAAVVCGFSGGGDSTVLAHLLRGRVTHYVHANTQIGAEPTRQYVRDTAAAWGVPLLERTPPKYGYTDLVLRRCPSVSDRAKYPYVWPGGFPGGPGHRTFYGFLKSRTFDAIRQSLTDSPRTQRVVTFDGRRAQESDNRKAFAKAARISGVPWRTRDTEVSASPLINWSKLDLNTYRRRFPGIPVNETADLLHMSMECACGCYAKPGEISQIELWLPTLADWIHGLEWQVARADLDIDPRFRIWGNGKGGGRCPDGMCNA